MFWSTKSDRVVKSEQITLDGTPEIVLTLRPSSRARRLSLRVARLDGRVTLTMPQGASRAEAIRFIQSRADWIRGHVANAIPELRPGIGDTVPFLGQPHLIRAASLRAPRVDAGCLLVPAGDQRATGIRLEAFFKREARDRLARASDRYAAMVGRSFGRLTIRDTRSRWGSCSSQGNLMYSWRLIMASEDVLNYVAAHEVAHLVHMDHSPAFWAQVEAIFPEHKTQRTWLRNHGSDLHRYRFRD